MTAPWAVLIGGAPATGKTTLAAALASQLRAAVIDLDVATGPLTSVVAELLGRTELSDPELAARTRAPRYDTLFALAAENLRSGVPVVLVAPFSAERSLVGWTAAADRLPARAVLLWLQVPPEELLLRLGRRGAVRDSGKIKDPASFLASLDLDPPRAPHIPLDAMMPTAELAQKAMSELRRLGLAIDGKA